jgi:hypothetical protein
MSSDECDGFDFGLTLIQSELQSGEWAEHWHTWIVFEGNVLF